MPQLSPSDLSSPWSGELMSCSLLLVFFCWPVRKGHLLAPCIQSLFCPDLTFSGLALLSAPVPGDSWCVLSVYSFYSLVGWYLTTYQLLTGGLDFEAFQCPKVFKADDIPTPVLPGRRVSTLECAMIRGLGLLEYKVWVGRKKSPNCVCSGDFFIVSIFWSF